MENNLKEPETVPVKDTVNAEISHSMLNPHKWEIWFANLGRHYGTRIQSGCRPVLIISNNASNAKAETVTVLPLTSKMKRLEMPCHTIIDITQVRRLAEPFYISTVLAEQITTIPKSALVSVLACVDDEDKKRDVEETVAAYLDMQYAEVSRYDKAHIVENGGDGNV